MNTYGYIWGPKRAILAEGFGFRALVCHLSSLRHGCRALLLDLMPVAVKAEYEDIFVADAQLDLLAPLALSGLPLPALHPRRAVAGAAVVHPGLSLSSWWSL